VIPDAFQRGKLSAREAGDKSDLLLPGGLGWAQLCAALKNLPPTAWIATLACVLFLGSAVAEEPSPQQVVDAAISEFQAGKYDQALEKLQQVEKTQPDSAFVQNLIGAVYTKKKDYAKAKAAFDKALDIDYSFFPAQFNQGEVLFLQKQYPQALDHFERMMRSAPDNELLQFKVVLCLLQTGQKGEAEKLAKRMKYPGQEPAWYFSQAALAINNKDSRKASENLAAAKELFRDKTSIYTETFQDLGWQTK